MHVVIVGHFAYPTGSASAVRVRCLAHGLAACGQRVSVVSLLPSRRAAKTSADVDWRKIDGISFLAAGGSIASRSPIAFVQQVWAAAGRTRRMLDELHDRVGIDAVIGYTNWHFPSDGLLRYLRHRGVTIAREINEWPLAERLAGRWINPLYWNQRLSFTRSMPRADGVIGISRMLCDHFAARGLPVLRVPPLSDTAAGSGFENAEPSRTASSLRLVFLGAGRLRDGLEVVVDAVRRLRTDDRDVRLDIVGDDRRLPAVERQRRKVANDPQLSERVTFHGWVSDTDVRRYLSEADVLILNRRAGLSSEASLPTRLPEYLMTGNPVIASDVGDVREYLTDGEDVLLVEPDSPEALAAGVERVLSMSDRGRAIGYRGRERCVACFDAAHHGTRISKFLETLVAARRKRAHN